MGARKIHLAFSFQFYLIKAYAAVPTVMPYLGIVIE